MPELTPNKSYSPFKNRPFFSPLLNLFEVCLLPVIWNLKIYVGLEQKLAFAKTVRSHLIINSSNESLTLNCKFQPKTIQFLMKRSFSELQEKNRIANLVYNRFLRLPMQNHPPKKGSKFEWRRFFIRIYSERSEESGAIRYLVLRLCVISLFMIVFEAFWCEKLTW